MLSNATITISKWLPPQVKGLSWCSSHPRGSIIFWWPDDFFSFRFLHRMIWAQIWLQSSCLNKKRQNEVFHCNDLMWYHTWPPDVIGGTSDQRWAWQKSWPNVNLTQSLICGWGYMWPEVSLTKVVTHLATRCLCQGRGYIWPKVVPGWSSTKLGLSLLGVHQTTCLCDQSSHTLGHKMSLTGGGSGWHFVW